MPALMVTFCIIIIYSVSSLVEVKEISRSLELRYACWSPVIDQIQYFLVEIKLLNVILFTVHVCRFDSFVHNILQDDACEIMYACLYI